MEAWHPQTVANADGTAKSASVDDNGWIRQTTDENGFATTYGYDAMGRLNATNYPSGDSTAWNSTAQTFERVGSDEYGIGAGHWRQTVTTGNAQKITYFDALWQPLLTREYDAANLAGTLRTKRFAYDHEEGPSLRLTRAAPKRRALGSGPNSTWWAGPRRYPRTASRDC